MRRRIGPALAIAAAALAGVTGCGALPGLGGNGGSPGGTSKGDGKVLDLPQKTVYLKGDSVPTPGLTTGPPVRGPIASISPLATVSPGRATPSPGPSECTGVVRPGIVNGLDVTPGTTTATVSWWNIGDPAITEYQLAAVPQFFNYGPQPGWTWQAVPPGKGCTRVTATVSGLQSQSPYVFVLHALLTKYESLPPTAPEVGRSEAVMML
ncbi:hypothetical protein ACFFX1_32550 [Dactylosporangium sucinum]|uniref:hypothetical protein n=1 Tax=Dactylosporangium sucinum TaxID=1424081 RepID=UPI00167E19DE|nr:hypothetical protein [Dactylosporangium sucinum]